MILNVHGSLGDQVLLTGIPRAYHSLFGEKTYINGGRPEIWEGNPYLTDIPCGKEFTHTPNAYPKDYMIYTPIRIFYDLTGYIADRSLVRPEIYARFNHWEQTCVVNDQAGWPSRVGYPYFDDLVKRIKGYGFTITYLYNENFRDCIGRCPPRQVTTYDHLLLDISLKNVIEVIGSCQIYLGYNSGLSQIAGALSIPYIQIEGSVPAVNTQHDSCIWCGGNKDCKRCCIDQCPIDCAGRLDKALNLNDAIENEIKEKYFGF